MRTANLHLQITDLLEKIYPEIDCRHLASQCLQKMELSGTELAADPHRNNWSESDVVLITYADSIRGRGDSHISTLHNFLTEKLRNIVSTVHVLPFFPYSSDDGFSVMDYTTVNPSLGSWSDINKLAEDFTVMSDLVINHCSSRSLWFENYKNGLDPGSGFFIEQNPNVDLSFVTRPRTSPLLKKVRTSRGDKYVWCTFGHDQIDLNFSNPAVLLEFISIVRTYIENGIRWFRLDAVGFLWKQEGTTCLNLPQTHEIIRVLRLLIGHKAPSAVIITETNVPNLENLSYFGNANEAHMIYNFSLPPLLLFALVSGDCSHLTRWLMSMPPAQHGTTYLNFFASHDGIGLRPAEGLLDANELTLMISTMESYGGKVSLRTAADGSLKPYEINISLWDAMSGTLGKEADEWQFERFMCGLAITVALEGVPALYIHSLLATENDIDKIDRTGNFRSINRHIWDEDELVTKLSRDTHHQKVFGAVKRLISIRRSQKSFHPNATMFTLHMGPRLFSFWRQSIDRTQNIFAIHNVSDQIQTFSLTDLNLVLIDQWKDLISGITFDDTTSQITLQPYQYLWLANRE